MAEQLALPGQTAAAYIEKKWGGPSRLVPIAPVTVSGNALRLLLNNPRRMFWIVVNIGVAAAQFSFDQTTLTNNSPTITSRGGAVSMAVDEDGEEVTREVWAFVASGTTTITGWEIMRK